MFTFGVCLGILGVSMGVYGYWFLSYPLYYIGVITSIVSFMIISFHYSGIADSRYREISLDCDAKGGMVIMLGNSTIECVRLEIIR